MHYFMLFKIFQKQKLNVGTCMYQVNMLFELQKKLKYAKFTSIQQ